MSKTIWSAGNCLKAAYYDTGLADLKKNEQSTWQKGKKSYHRKFLVDGTRTGVIKRWYTKNVFSG